MDEIGVPVASVALAMTIPKLAATQAATTAGDGRYRHDGKQLDHSRATIVDDALREKLRPRWDGVRPEPWLAPQTDHTFVPLRQGVALEATLLEATPHTLVVQPWCVRLRVIGLYFDSNKCFLLPTARAAMQHAAEIYAKYPDSLLLVVGHTDATGDAPTNDPLSVERADATIAFLRDDVGAWLAWYGSDKPFEKRWGWREDRAMIAALDDAHERPLDEPEVVWFQRTRGLTVDGWAGPETRTALIAEYMSLDGTTLPADAPVLSHGCGESFPNDHADASNGDATPGVDPEESQADRRVELFLFDRALGVQPPPPGDVSPPDSLAYPEWIRRSQYTQDVFVAHTDGPAVRLCNASQHPLPHAAARFVGSDVVHHADAGGWLALDDSVINQEQCELEWTHPGQEATEPWPFRRRMYLDLGTGEEADRRRLHNVGYPYSDALEDSVAGFELDFRPDQAVTRRLGTIAGQLREWHDGGARDNSALVLSDAAVRDPHKVGTVGPFADIHRVRVSVFRATSYLDDPIDPATLSYTWLHEGELAPPNKRAQALDEDGVALADFDGVVDGPWTLVVEEHRDGIVVGRGKYQGSIGAPAQGSLVKLQVPLQVVPWYARFFLGKESHGPAEPNNTVYGFEQVPDPSHATKLAMKDLTDVVRCQIFPEGTSAQASFQLEHPDGTPSSEIVAMTPTEPAEGPNDLRLVGLKPGRVILKVLDTESGRVLGELNILVGELVKRRIGGVAVIEKTWKSPVAVDWGEIDKLVTERFLQAGVAIEFTAYPPESVTYDFNKDGRLDIDSVLNDLDIGHASDELKAIHSAAFREEVDVMLYAVNRGDSTVGHRIVGCVMAIGHPAAFIFPDTLAQLHKQLGVVENLTLPMVASHEVGHSLGLHHNLSEAGNLMYFTTHLGQVGPHLRAWQWAQLNPTIQGAPDPPPPPEDPDIAPEDKPVS